MSQWVTHLSRSLVSGPGEVPLWLAGCVPGVSVWRGPHGQPGIRMSHRAPLQPRGSPRSRDTCCRTSLRSVLTSYHRHRVCIITLLAQNTKHSLLLSFNCCCLWISPSSFLSWFWLAHCHCGCGWVSWSKYYVNSAHIWAKVEIGSEMRKIKMKMNFNLFISLAALDLVAQFVVLAGWAEKRDAWFWFHLEKVVVGSSSSQIFVEIKHFWLPWQKMMHVFE